MLGFRQYSLHFVVVGCRFRLGSLGSFIPFPAEYGAEGVPRLPDAVPTLVVWLGIWLDVMWPLYVGLRFRLSLLGFVCFH